MPHDEYTPRRIQLYESARSIIQTDRGAFRRAGTNLSELFSEALVLEHNPSLAIQSERAMLLARLNAARLAATVDNHLKPGSSTLDAAVSDLDFSLDRRPTAEAVAAARMVVLAIVIAADPNCNETITEEICEFAQIPWCSDGDEWSERFAIVWSESGWHDHDRPSPRVLDVLESAIACIRVYGATQDYDITKPGRNPVDEARRALADIVRLGQVFTLRAIRYAELEHGRHEDRGDVMADVRQFWPEWTPALKRGHVALHGMRQFQLAIDIRAAETTIDNLRSIFDEPMFLHPSESPGDHLFRPAGPLAARKGTGTNLRIDELAVHLDLLAVLSNRLRGIDEAGITEHARAPMAEAGEWWPASEFGPKLAARIRQAAVPKRRTKRVRSQVIDGVRLYSVDDARRWWGSEIP